MAVEDDLGGQGEDPTHIMSPYEQSRERRIRENLERMRKMGILHITQKLRASSAGIRKRGRPTSLAVAARRRNEDGTGAGGSLRQLTPLRRSSRLQNAMPVTYPDVLLSGRVSGRTKSEKAISAAADKQTLFEEGTKPEAYTEEHEKLLGSTEKSWELCVDGYGNDGRWIYDPFKGKSCHQCRQKTLGHRTECSQCGMVQGRFCGDCLYMRYGEHVLEALENPKWICPVCRGICNCSLCRQAKGWAPTGPLYRKISSMGFKSVAHYLIQTRRLQLKLETQTHSDPPAHLSAKRSLLFSNHVDCKDPPEENMEIKNFHIDSTKEQNGSLTIGRVSAGHLSIRRSLSFISDDNSTVAEEEALDHQIGTEEHSEERRTVVGNRSVSKNSGQAKKRASCSELNQDNIGERLRLRKNSLCLFSNDNNAKTEQAPDNQRGNKEQKEGRQRIVMAAINMAANSLKQLSKHGACREPNQDSIGGRLRLKTKSLCLLSDGKNGKTEQVLDYQRGKGEHNQGHHIVMATISEAANSFEQVKKHGSCSKPNQDDIGGGLCSTNKSFCLLLDDCQAKMELPLDNPKGNEEQNEGHYIVVPGICVTASSSKPVKKYAPCSKLNQDSIGGRLRSRKKSLCLLSGGNNAATKQSLDYQRDHKEPNENHRIVVAAISAAANSLQQVKKISSCSESSQDSIGGRFQARKKTLCLLSDGNNAKTEQLQDYQRGNEEHNEDHRIVVAAISAATNSFRQVKHGSCGESNQDDIGGRLCLRKKSLCLLSDYNNAKMDWPQDYRRGNKEHNEDRRIIVAAISAAANSFTQVKKYDSCSESNQDDIGGRLCLRKKSFCLLSDYNNAKMEWSPDYQSSNKEQNEDHRIVVAAISAAANSLRPVKTLEPCRELYQDSIGGRHRLRKRSSSVLFDGNCNAEAIKALDNWEGDEVKSIMKTGTR